MPSHQVNPFLQAVVFDLDGTLIDSADVYIKILNTAFRHIGLPEVSRSEAFAAIRDGGLDWSKILPGCLDDKKKERIQQVMEVVARISPHIFMEEVDLIPGADDVLRDLYGLGLKLGIVTSTQMRFLQYKLLPLKRAGVDHVFGAIVTTDDVRERKPEAEPLIECGRRLSVDPAGILYVGDSCVDIRAGKAAGTMTVGVLTGVDDYEMLHGEEPDGIVESVTGLRDILLPLRAP